MIPLRVFGPSGDDDLIGLADTGADDTLLPDILIEELGVVIAASDRVAVGTFDGGVSIVRYGWVDLELPGYRWSAKVGFHANYKVLLGISGFLCHFTASFNGQRRYVNLTPNGTAPAPRIPLP
jgi:hypothetical protein